MKGAFSASRQTGSVSRHYPSTLITFYPLPGRNWTCGTYAPGVTTAMLMYPKNRPPKGTARVKGREVETVSHITCFINFKPRFDIIVQVVSISQIVAKYESRLSMQTAIWKPCFTNAKRSRVWSRFLFHFIYSFIFGNCHLHLCFIYIEYGLNISLILIKKACSVTSCLLWFVVMESKVFVSKCTAKQSWVIL